jgi:hypothetical protein
MECEVLWLSSYVLTFRKCAESIFRAEVKGSCFPSNFFDMPIGKRVGSSCKMPSIADWFLTKIMMCK